MKAGITTHEDLDVFNLAHQLVLRIYQTTRSFPREEMFGLVSQLRRAASSVPANIAEGAGRLNRAEYRRFVGIAGGAAVEVSYFLRLACDLGYISQPDYDDLCREYERVCKMLTRLSQAL
jgi:four helix bundle protein